MKKTLKINADIKNISQGMQFVEGCLKGVEFKENRDRIMARLQTEEMLTGLIEHSNGPDDIVDITVSVRRKRVNVHLSCPGEKFDLTNPTGLADSDTVSLARDENSLLVNSLILKAFSDTLEMKHYRGINKGSIKIEGNKKKYQMGVASAIVIAVILGLILRLLVPLEVSMFISDNIFGAISGIFMNAIKLLMAPLVFFSISSSLCDFSDFGTFGKMGAKVIGWYFALSFVSVGLSTVFSAIFSPGDPSLLPAVKSVAGNAPVVDVASQSTESLGSIISGLVPSNFMYVFVESNMIHIIVIAVMVGIASGGMARYSENMRNFLNTGNELFFKLMNIVIKLLPLSVLSLFTKMIITTDVSAFESLVKIFLIILLVFAALVLVFALLIRFLGRVSPLIYFKKMKDAIVSAFTSSSSAVAIPFAMKGLESLGVSKSLYTFSIPLGSTINMCGSCILNTMSTFFMMNIYGITFPAYDMIFLFVTIVLISMATPAAPGASFAALGMVFTTAGIPVEAVSFLVVIITILDFFITAINSMGDSVVSVLVARSEKMLDMEKYYE